MDLTQTTSLFVPNLDHFEDNGLHYLIDAEAPNWIATDSRGYDIIRRLQTKADAPTIASLAAGYAASQRVDMGKAVTHMHDFVSSMARHNMISTLPFERSSYPGRFTLAPPERLRELWFQLNNACNLTCRHCLVGSGPREDRGLPSRTIANVIRAVVEADLERVYVTGGEPFLRTDLFDHLGTLADSGVESIVLTNGTIWSKDIEKRVGALPRDLVRFQISLDGVDAETSDAIRGKGTFARASETLQRISALGFAVSVTTVVTKENLQHLHAVPKMAASLGATSVHLMWSHRRGRALASLNGFFPDPASIIKVLPDVIRSAHSTGLELDNLEVIRRRVNGVPGVKYDLGNAGWDSLCVYADGKVYPSAAFANVRPMLCGDLTETPLVGIWEDSIVCRELRQSTIAKKPNAARDPFRFLTGGGDMEHSFFFSGDVLGDDPYYPISQVLARQAMTELGEEKRTRTNRLSGYDAPLVLHAMGEGAVACATADGSLASKPVLTLHSNCVLSFDVDKPRAKVREFYSTAAESVQPDLCCPTAFDPETIAHIPKDVIDRFYGCGSPVTLGGIRPGETVLDLGSGAGIDVFIAAKLVGAGGRAIGIDMTDKMLAVANENRPKVAAALGYDVAEFHEGFLESIPVGNASVDLITSNCVINLSPDKQRVFEEMWRALADHGRIVISDIIAHEAVPPHLKVNPRLWGECLVGALTEAEFISELERAGFFGIEILRKSYWKSVEGYAFHSITVRGWKFEKKEGCVFRGQKAVYLGPGKSILDEEGHQFFRGEPLEVCTDTAAKLGRAPYSAMFAIIEPEGSEIGYSCSCAEGTGCC